MNTFKLIVLFVLASAFEVDAQLTLETCRQKARDHYPLTRQYGLIEQTAQFTVDAANKGYLPQVSVSVRASYQSDVTAIPESLSQILSQMTGREVTFPTLSRDQYQLVVEANQLIWDGGAIAVQNKITSSGSEVEKQKLEVDLYALNERVDQLFFGILLIDEQLLQTQTLKSDLQTSYNRLKACYDNGVANLSDLDVIKVEQINVVQRETEMKSNRQAFWTMLSTLIGLPSGEIIPLLKPEIPSAFSENQINRPELNLFEAQNNWYDSQKSLIGVANRPRIGAYLQGGYGQPGLNMFSTGFSPYYLCGIRLSWSLSGLYTQKNNLGKLAVGKQQVDLQKETFLFNTQLKINQQTAEIQKLRTLINNDTDIICLRTSIKQVAASKVENGTLTATDLVREINAEDQARRLKSLHETQLLMAIFNLKNTTNN